MDKPIDPLAKYKCKTCGKISDTDTLIKVSDQKFIDNCEPGFEWIETHRCCGTKFTYKNGC